MVGDKNVSFEKEQIWHARKLIFIYFPFEKARKNVQKKRDSPSFFSLEKHQQKE